MDKTKIWFLENFSSKVGLPGLLGVTFKTF
jgi:hypothetical protein